MDTKPIIISLNDMKVDISNIVNKHLKYVPADVIADFLEKVAVSVRQIAEQQLKSAMEDIKKTEVNENDSE